MADQRYGNGERHRFRARDRGVHASDGVGWEAYQYQDTYVQLNVFLPIEVHRTFIKLSRRIIPGM